MTARSGMTRGNPGPDFPRTPSAPRVRTTARSVSPSHECSRPRRPQR